MRRETLDVTITREARIDHDPDPMSPREWSNLGTLVIGHRRYAFGDENMTSQGDTETYLLRLLNDLRHYPDEDEDVNLNALLERLQDVAVVLPVFMMEHSGIRLSTSAGRFRAFDHQEWDRGMVGFIYCTIERGAQEFGEVDDLRERVEDVLRAEVAAMDDFVSGNVLMYSILDVYRDEDGDVLKTEYCDGCGGIQGSDALDEIQNMLREHGLDDDAILEAIDAFENGTPQPLARRTEDA